MVLFKLFSNILYLFSFLIPKSKSLNSFSFNISVSFLGLLLTFKSIFLYRLLIFLISLLYTLLFDLFSTFGITFLEYGFMVIVGLSFGLISFFYNIFFTLNWYSIYNCNVQFIPISFCFPFNINSLKVE